MPLDVDIYEQKEALGPGLITSTALHAALAAALIFGPAIFNHHGEDWGNNGNGGNPGEAMSANLVSGIPLPPNPQAKPDQVLADDSKGLSESQPAPQAKPAEDKDAIAIPDRNAKPPKQQQKQPPVAPHPQPNVKPQPAVRTPTASNVKPRQMAKPDNTVPFGAGGPVSGPFTTFQSGNTMGGMKFGEGGTGGFGSRFGWYTDVVARKVHEAWISEVNPGVNNARRVYLTFDITREGRPKNVRIEQSSGVPSLDYSAMRAVQRIDTFGPLPQGYNGSYVTVEFWFDYRR